MFRLTAYVLAALAIMSFFIPADAQAGSRHERRIHKHVKNSNFRYNVRMRDINADSRYNGGQRLDNGRKRFTRSTLSFRSDGNRRNSYRHNHRHRYHIRNRINTSAVVIINVDGNKQYRLPVYRRPGVNTYSGNVDVYSVPGVGTYSYTDSSNYDDAPLVTTGVPSAKIIDVSKLKPNDGCEMQSGVCVIRP